MVKYEMILIVKPVKGQGGDISTYTIKAGKQRLQNLFKVLVRAMDFEKR